MTERPRVLAVGPGNDRILTKLGEAFEVLHAPDRPSMEAILSDPPPVQAIATLWQWKLDADVFDKLPDLKVISNFGVGYDAIDAVEAAKRGIIVAHTPDVLNDEVVDTTLMLWLAVSRELVPSERWARSGEWEAKGAYPLTRSIRNRTVGIVGLGRIGLGIAEMAEGYGSTILYHTRTPKNVAYTHYADLVEMARECDVMIVITPGGASTRHLVNADVMHALGPEGILINVARGSVVDEVALVAALETGRLGAAGLDVFDEEPKIPEALKTMDNVVLLPHVGSASLETRQAMGDLVCDNLSSWAKEGRVLTPVPECKELNG